MCFMYRYPIILRQFSVRHNSGGSGRYTGGCGVYRELEFTKVSGTMYLWYFIYAYTVLFVWWH